MHWSKKERAKGYKKLVVCGDDHEVKIYKKPSVKEIRENHRQTIDSYYGHNHEYDDYDKTKIHYGVYNKKGWKCLRLFETREEAQEYLDGYGRLKDKYEIRESELYEDYDGTH